jgi:hypothetical protein
MYQRNENTSNLNYLRKFVLPLKSNEIISSFALSQNEEILLVATNQNHLYQLDFSKIVKVNRVE